MSNYKIAKVPFPVKKGKEIIESFERSKDTAGGMAIRYRMPKEMVAMLNEDVGGGADKSFGMGMGACIKCPFLLQPRQMDGIKNAKEKGKAYNLVLSKKQLQAMKGQGIFSSILSAVAGPLAEVAVGAIAKKVKGKGELAEEGVDFEEGEEADEGGRDDDDGSGIGECDICPKCMGSGFLPLLAALPFLKEPRQQRPPPRMPRKPGPPRRRSPSPPSPVALKRSPRVSTLGSPQKNGQGALTISV